MKPAKVLSILIFLMAIAAPAFAANLNTTSTWRNWQQAYRQVQQLESQAYQAARTGTSAGYRQAANLLDRTATIHTNYANAFESMARTSPDPSIRTQAAYQGNSRRIAARSAQSNARSYRNYARQAAARGR